MLTILHTESSMGWGGQENRTLNEAVELARRGHRVIIACQPGSGLEQKGREADLGVETLPIRSSLDVSAISSLCRLMTREKVQILNTHSGKDSWAASLAARLSRSHPAIIRTRHLALPVRNRFTYQYLPHKVITVSQYVRDYLVKVKGVRADKVVAIPTGVDAKRYDPYKTYGDFRHELGLSPAVPLVGMVAIFRYKKGHHVLIQAAREVLASFPATRFLLLGHGPQEPNIRRLIGELGLERSFLLMGLMNNVQAVLKALDVFVLPSLEEALGTSILEAMAMERPVVATNVGGIPEVVRDGETGFLVPPRDPRALAQGIVRVLADRGMALDMGRKGRVLVERHFTLEGMVERTLELYQGLITVNHKL